MMVLCDRCGGVGLVRTETGYSTACSCQLDEARRIRLARAGIPPGFAGASLENFEPCPHNRKGLAAARAFARDFLPGFTGKDIPGLLLTGSVGTGKTHLAAGVLRYLVEEKGIDGRFVTVPDFLDRLRQSYDKGAAETTGQIFAPTFAADLVVIDELGAARPSDWVFETIELLIGGLYNRMTPVIVTSNFANLPAGGSRAAENDYARAARPETLEDRIGKRMFSRLQQMCTAIDMTGADYRTRRQ
jgi:DNA replication protein DnaC